MLELRPTELPEVIELVPKRFGDDRGFFSETYNQKRFVEAGITCAFVQDNHSLSVDKLTLRGLHFQSPPHAQDKLVRVIRGSIWDVAVDIRIGSQTFGKWTGRTLTPDEGNQLFIPVGFAHGFLTLERDTEVTYKTSAYYDANADGCLHYADPAFNIDWPINGQNPILSDKDSKAQNLSEASSPFKL
jgi:dTDP-4-dehydrorhamnose 3,5-epimerase